MAPDATIGVNSTILGPTRKEAIGRGIEGKTMGTDWTVDQKAYLSTQGQKVKSSIGLRYPNHTYMLGWPRQCSWQLSAAEDFDSPWWSKDNLHGVIHFSLEWGCIIRPGLQEFCSTMLTLCYDALHLAVTYPTADGAPDCKPSSHRLWWVTSWCLRRRYCDLPRLHSSYPAHRLHVYC